MDRLTRRNQTKLEQSLITPAFLIDIAKVRKNCEKMRKICSELKVKFRPQTKTHKTLDLAVEQTGVNKRCIVVSTLPEAELYAANDFEDILYGYPLTADKLERCQKLTEKLQVFHIMIDNEEIISKLEQTNLSCNKKWSAFLAIDCGYGREGVLWNDASGVALAEKMFKSEKVHFAGVYVHCGNSYKDKSKVQQVEKETTERILSFVKRLEENNIKCSEYGTGSTPTCSQATNELGKLTELHPGNYVFYDAQQWSLGSCKEEEIAVRVGTRIIGHKPHLNQLLIDCGWEGLSLDGGPDKLPSGYAVIQGEPNLKLIGMTQEIGKIVPTSGAMDFSKYPIGKLLYLYPYHSCATAAMHPIYYLVDNEVLVKTIEPVRGW